MPGPAGADNPSLKRRSGMAINDRMIAQAYADLHESCGGVKNDYFGLLYLEQEFRLKRERAMSQVAFGGNDYGIDGFHFDRDTKNLYLFQFKYSTEYGGFRVSFQRLIEAGMDRIFGAKNQDQLQNPLLVQLKSCLLEYEGMVERVCIYFVFMGDPAEAERSSVLEKLREDLENKKYLVDQRFGRSVTLVIEFRSGRTGKVGSASHLRKTNTYTLHLEQPLTRNGPSGEVMTVGFVRLADLHAMFRDMGQRFFDCNIRSALPEGKAVNRSIAQALKRIVLDRKDLPSVFAFNHNGVTLSAEALAWIEGDHQVTEPRLLNGAQTIITVDRFLKSNEGNAGLVSGLSVFHDISVLCKVITNATSEFVTSVTINNNRQNPVDPADLHANDMIQRELQDKFRNDLEIYYERQENAFANLSDEELEEQGITVHKAVELQRLARTFLVSDGNIDKLTSFRDVFEDDRIYAQVFNASRLSADARKALLCYKVQFKLRRLADVIVDRGVNRYEFVRRARNLLWALLCQGMLNDPRIEEYADEFGHGVSVEAQFTDWLSKLATTRCRLLLSDLIKDDIYAARAAEGNFSFLRTNGAYKRCMESAYGRWKWVEKRLK